MRTIVVVRGLPACGKSSFAAELVKNEPKRWLRFNRDDLRSMVVGPGNNPHEPRDNDREKLVHNLQNEFVRQALREGYDVVLDNTHLVPATMKKIHELAAFIGDVKVVEKAFNVSAEECIARDAKRTGFAQVGPNVINAMARAGGLDKGRKLVDKETYYPARWVPGGAGSDPTTMTQDESLPTAIICDLDGTLSLLNGRSPYDATHCDKDLPNRPVIECVKAMHAQGVQVLFTSGRDAKYREPTVRFIEQWMRESHKLPDGSGKGSTNGTTVIPYQLFMRKEGDMRKDSIIKTEIFDENFRGKYNVLFCLDDRNQVVDNWREMGLVCFQVAPGAF